MSLQHHACVAVHGRQESEEGKAFCTIGPVPFFVNNIPEDLQLQDFSPCNWTVVTSC